MICPKCGKEMEEGFLLTLPNMEWIKGESRPETERLGSMINLGSREYEHELWRYYTKSFRCENCRLVTFLY